MDGQNTQNEGYVVERGGQPINPTQPQTGPTSGQPQASPTSGQDEPYIVEKAGSGTSDTSNAPLAGHHVTDTAFGAPSGPGMSLKGLGNAVVSGIGGAAVGAGEGVFATAKGAAQLANKIPGVNIPTQKLGELAGENEPQNTAEKVGYGGETLMEFLAGDEALKGLGLADRLMKAGKIAKTLEASPRLTMALKAGAESLRAGTAQAGQTFVRTGGNAGQALKEGAEMAPIAGAGSIIGEGVKAVGEGIKTGVEGQQALQYVADRAPSTASTTSDIADKIKSSEDNLHQTYEQNIRDFKNRLSGEELDPTDRTLPMSQKASNLLQKPVPAEHEITRDLKNALGDKLDKPVRTVLEKASSGYSQPVDFNKTIDVELPKSGGLGQTPTQSLGGQQANKVTMNQYQYYDPTVKQFITNPVVGRGLKFDVVDMSKIKPEDIDFTNGTFKGSQIPNEALIKRLSPYTIDDLIDFRQTARALADQYPYGDTNSRTLRAFRGSIDDTIGTLANQSGDLSLPGEYADLRKYYGERIHAYDDPIIDNLRQGKYGDAVKEVLGGSNKMAPRLQQLSTALGPQAMDDFRKEVFSTLLDTSRGPHKELNPALLLQNWKKVPDASKEVLFNQGVPSNVINELMKDAKTARNLQYLSRVGVVGPLVTNGGLLYHMGLLGALALTEGTFGKFGGVRQVIDYVADHPAMWKAWGMAGKATESAGEAAKPVAAAVGQTVSGANQARKKQVMQGASALAGQ